MSSPVAPLLSGLMRQMSQEAEGSVFIDDDQRKHILRNLVDGYYWDIHPEQMVLDTNRGWTSKMALLAQLFPKSKVICCVRNPAWVMDSIERLTSSNPLEPSGLFKFDTAGNVYMRAELLTSGAGMVGNAMSCLREAVFGTRRDQLLLVRFETLTKDPLATLAAVYDFLGEPPFAHDSENIEQDFTALEFDARIGAPGLHAVGSRVKYTPRATVLPPDLFSKLSNDDFWERPREYPEGLRVI